jgi:hypothetical protein
MFSSEQYFLLGESVVVPGRIEAPSETPYFILELSRSPRFLPEEVVVEWSEKRDFSWQFNQVGPVYVKARGVNSKLEITSESPVFKFSVVKPDKALAPKLASNSLQVYENEELPLSWQKNSKAHAYEIEMRGPNGEILQKQRLAGNKWTWQGGRRGQYQANIYSIDAWGRKSETPSHLKVDVLPKPVLAQAQKHEERKVASEPENKLSTKLESNDLTYLNRKFNSSKFFLEGSGMTMFSSEQVDQTDQPIAMLLGIRVQKWFESIGLEASLKAKAMNVNEAASDVSPLQAEGRFHYRLPMKWNLFSKLNESQISAILGFEAYRNNSSSRLFSQQYDLIKAGFSLSFPLLNRWDTGGEVLYGYGMDRSTKTEIAGYVNYYLRREWSMGMGYRIHLFEAGSTASSGAGYLPYREGFGEGYSVLRWHY